MNAETLTAIGTICAAMSSVVAIGLSIIALSMQRSHDRKSVIPIPQFEVGDFEDRTYVRLVNAGVGPMIVENLAVTNVVSGRTENSVMAFMPDLPPRFYWSDFIGDVTGRAVQAEHVLYLVDFTGISEEIEEHYLPQARINVRKEIRLALAQLRLTVTVRDIYGQVLPQHVRALTWFARDEELSKKQAKAAAANLQV